MIEMTASPLATEEPDDDDCDPMPGLNGRDPNIVVIRDGRHGDDEEALGLMSGAESLTRDEFSLLSADYEVDDDRMCSGSFRILVLSMSCVLVIAILAVLLPGIRDKTNALEALRTPARIPVDYECRAVAGTETSGTTPNDNIADIGNPTDNGGGTAAAANLTEFLQTFRDAQYEDWGKSYNQVKEGMYHFKSTYFPPYLIDGGTIYESDCGNGLNLFMTLEILQETHDIENLFVYGNDPQVGQDNQASAIFDHAAPARGRKGNICAADSSRLGFIPANAFDLVFTGYISPLLDPLHFNLGTSENFDRYTYICNSDPVESWAEGTLNVIAQQRQNDWYGAWVAEMARIAKPGVPVIVEHVSQPYCDAVFDWGGVQKQWWYDAATNNTYGWNVDANSLVIEDDALFQQRYHVFMLKHGKRDN